MDQAVIQWNHQGPDLSRPGGLDAESDPGVPQPSPFHQVLKIRGPGGDIEIPDQDRRIFYSRDLFCNQSKLFIPGLGMPGAGGGDSSSMRPRTFWYALLLT